MLARRDGEDLVELFETESLRLRDEQENEHGADGVPGGIPAECALRGEGVEESGERESDDEV